MDAGAWMSCGISYEIEHASTYLAISHCPIRLFWIKSKTCDLADLACSCSGLCSNSLLGFSLAPSCGACTIYVWLQYSQYRKGEAATLCRKLKAEAPARHIGQSALGQPGSESDEQSLLMRLSELAYSYADI